VGDGAAGRDWASATLKRARRDAREVIRPGVPQEGALTHHRAGIPGGGAALGDLNLDNYMKGSGALPTERQGGTGTPVSPRS
jgi:hypothetical protein